MISFVTITVAAMQWPKAIDDPAFQGTEFDSNYNAFLGLGYAVLASLVAMIPIGYLGGPLLSLLFAHRPSLLLQVCLA